GEIGDAGRLTRLVLAVDDVLDLGQEQRRRPHQRVVALAALDGGVARLVPVQLRVVEVDDDLAAGQSAPAGLAVQIGRPGLHTVDRALEQTGSERVVDVGHHRDVDLGGRDPDLGGLRLLVARLGGRRPHADCRQADEQRADHDRVPDLDHGSPPRVDASHHSYTTRRSVLGALGPGSVTAGAGHLPYTGPVADAGAPMRIAIGSDHAGYRLKEHFIAVLKEGGHEVHDLGTDSEAPV